MKLEVKTLDIRAGKPVIILNEEQAKKESIFLGDRVRAKSDHREIRAVVDLSKDIPGDKAIFFDETKKELKVEEDDSVEIETAMKPDSVEQIVKKINGEKLEREDIYSIVRDTVDFKLTETELMAYNVAIKMSDFSFEEAKHMTEAMVDTGERINIENALDKHCIGGVPGNRTTPLIVPIIAAEGHKIPKTSSRAISSPAGTADTMEVLTDVEHTAEDIKELVEKTNGCMVWGGSLDLAPADDEFIRARGSLDLDPLEQVLSSVLAKKKSVGAETVLIDIPMGEGAKVSHKEEAKKLSKYFKRLGRELGMNVVTIISEGSRPIGQGIGPALEARDVLQILESRGQKGPEDLRDKALEMANILLDEASSGKIAEEILESGDAYTKFKEIIEAQGGGITKSENVPLAEKSYTVEANKRGRVEDISNEAVGKIAELAGCPKEKKSGIYLHKRMDDPVEKGQKLITVYSENKERLEAAADAARERPVYTLKSLMSK
ncbi:MAG: AMP phosphorylase [Candidatus Aenigmatarchaeota archaeon]